MMSSLKRFCRHLFSGPWLVRRYFSTSAMHHIEAAIEASERQHSGQIRFVVEPGLHPYSLIKGLSPRARALEVFSALGIWDTAQNNGVLIYLLLADHDVEIVADRGIHHFATDQLWASICHEMEHLFSQGQFETGVLYGVEKIGQLLAQAFLADQANENELPNQPVVL
ncbi:MAG: TPM domain-containing protein [Nitrosomonadales bacterium]|nr:TPM domain-containing protein [Nitrosomonadales bacterium]